MKINKRNHQILTILSKTFLFISILLTAIFTSILTYKINEFLSPSGQPNILAKINGFTFRQDIKTNKCSGEIFLNILNIDDKKTLISLKNIIIEIPLVNSTPVRINFFEKIELNPYSNVTRSINYDIGKQILIQSDSLKSLNIIIKGECYYPSGDLAMKLHYDNKNDPSFKISHIWRSPNIAQLYNELKKLSSQNKLPQEWQKVDLEYGNRTYDCYYRPSSYKIGINKEGEIFKIRHFDKDNDIFKLGNWKKIEQYDFIPNPAIKDHFVDLNIRTIRYNPLIYKDQNITVLRKFKLNIYANHKNLICFRLD